MATRAIGEMAIFYGDKQNSGQYDNGVWMDLLDIPWITKIEEASLYKTVIRTLWLEAIGWGREIRNRYPHIRQIGLVDHPLSAHISRMSADRQFAFVSDLQYLDGIMALTEEERQWYSTAVPSKPVECVGLPFPFESYEKKYGHLRDSEKDVIGLGVGASDNDRNFVSNIMAFQKLQLKYPDLKGVFLSIPSQLVPYCAYWADRVDNLFIHQREDMPQYYEMLSRCKFVISLTDRNTPGRLQGEAAFFKVPVIGSNRLELQERLFPQWSVKPFAIEEVVDYAEQILEMPGIAEGLSNTAYEMLKEYNYENSLKKFKKLISRIETGAGVNAVNNQG